MQLNEIFPNPIGKDTTGEWLELFNNEQNSVNLLGWKIKDASGKTIILKENTISPFGYFVLNCSKEKLTLNNAGETIYLYDPVNKLIDKAGYSILVSEGKSLAREGDKFIISAEPTPGHENKLLVVKQNQGVKHLTNSLEANVFDSQSSVLFNKKFNADVQNIFIGFSLSAILSFLFVIAYKKIKSGQK